MKYEFIRRHRKEYKIVRLCEVLEVSTSGYYDWFDRPESNRSRGIMGSSLSWCILTAISTEKRGHCLTLHWKKDGELGLDST